MANQSVRHIVIIAAIGLLLNGCSYGQSFSCKGYPEGVRCQDVMTVYENRQAIDKMVQSGDEPGGWGLDGTSSGATSVGMPPPPTIESAPGAPLGQPAITPPKVARVWIAPWRDEKNRLHEASVVYMMVEESDWVYGQRPRQATPSRGRGSIVPTVSALIERPGQHRNAEGVDPAGTDPLGRPGRERMVQPPRPPMMMPTLPNTRMPSGVPMVPMVPMGSPDTAVGEIMGEGMGSDPLLQ
ncbi:MAG: type IV conjugative transfer system lipoprotein TraV [Nitrospirota bacterium]